MRDDLEIIKAARELISDPDRWTQGAYAKDNLGRWTYVSSPDAKCWCSTGAVYKAAVCDIQASIRVLKALDKAVGVHTKLRSNIIHFNDAHTHPEVLAIFDKAIENFESGANAAANSPALAKSSHEEAAQGAEND